MTIFGRLINEILSQSRFKNKRLMKKTLNCDQSQYLWIFYSSLILRNANETDLRNPFILKFSLRIGWSICGVMQQKCQMFDTAFAMVNRTRSSWQSQQGKKTVSLGPMFCCMKKRSQGEMAPFVLYRVVLLLWTNSLKPRTVSTQVCISKQLTIGRTSQVFYLMQGCQSINSCLGNYYPVSLLYSSSAFAY